MISDAPGITSPGNVVLLSYTKEMRNLGVAAAAGRTNTLENGISYMTVWQRLFAFSPKHLRVYFSDQLVIEP